ncbi:hypothetical protein DTU56_09305 [Salmonella enterica subsp. enterica serovar Muenchen]|uniref:Uncharacterized protein n=1 Tax=Salmonella muenchen TaxID=596 RepID=A0A5U8XKH4_SALMU|nr:hypothetical protein [Salmonella enterica subsp. enterica serovar Muenchen]
MSQNINRKVSAKKDVYYAVGEVVRAVIDKEQVLHLAVPSEVTRADRRMLDKLVIKAKARDGVRSVKEVPGTVMELVDGEIHVRRSAAA